MWWVEGGGGGGGGVALERTDIIAVDGCWYDESTVVVVMRATYGGRRRGMLEGTAIYFWTSFQQVVYRENIKLDAQRPQPFFYSLFAASTRTADIDSVTKASLLTNKLKQRRSEDIN